MHSYKKYFLKTTILPVGLFIGYEYMIDKPHKLSVKQQQQHKQQQQQQQQQQHSFLSQASWGRLEMKPKRHKGHDSGTLIASLQALLSKATSSGIFQSLRSLLTNFQLKKVYMLRNIILSISGHLN